jgi:hypothetical protein
VARIDARVYQIAVLGSLLGYGLVALEFEVLFAFFMISDPRTTPDSRAGRILFAALVALGAYYVQFRLFRTNGLLWSLAACSLLVPLVDRLLPGGRYEWRRAPTERRTVMGRFTRVASILAVVTLASVSARPALAFCGFYVAKADTKLFNQASQVVLVRDGDRTVMTMVNDFKGDLRRSPSSFPCRRRFREVRSTWETRHSSIISMRTRLRGWLSTSIRTRATGVATP